jgi:radical SAM superfamily enzyme YgiQ (UPF0313 family)
LKIKEIKKTNLTFAPETGENLRKKIGKNISDDEILNLALKARKNNYRHIKLYFMIGLPDEKDNDIEDIVKLINEISNIIFVKASFNTFIPKPHTFYQNKRFITKEEYEGKRNYITEKLKKNKYVKFNFQPYEVSCIECILGRGDERLSKIIYKVWERGAKFENWKEFFDFNKWIECFKGEGIDIKDYLKESDFSSKWNFIEI